MGGFQGRITRRCCREERDRKSGVILIQLKKVTSTHEEKHVTKKCLALNGAYISLLSSQGSGVIVEEEKKKNVRARDGRRLQVSFEHNRVAAHMNPQ